MSTTSMLLSSSSRGNPANWARAVDRLGNLDRVPIMNLIGTSVNDDVLAELDRMSYLRNSSSRVRASATPD